jgi:hypothetical protein
MESLNTKSTSNLGRLANMKKYLSVALAVAALASAGTAPAFAQAYSGGYGTGNVSPFSYPSSTGGSGHAQAPAAIHQHVARSSRQHYAHVPTVAGSAAAPQAAGQHPKGHS